jgi:hypothetical protein
VSICFLENHDPELNAHLKKVLARERVQPMPFDVILDDGGRLDGCEVAGSVRFDAEAEARRLGGD